MDNRKRLTDIERIKKREIFNKAVPAQNVKRGDSLRGKVYNVTSDGAFIQTEENYIGFIHHSEQSQELKEGMTVEGRVTFVREDGRINLSLKPQKEYARLIDAEKVMEYLKRRKGSMPFTDDSPPEVISEKFGMSKGAFKRALGKLFKDGVIIEENGWIVLKENPEDDGQDKIDKADS